MSIAAALGWVHGVRGKDGVEHVGAVDLGAVFVGAGGKEEKVSWDGWKDGWMDGGMKRWRAILRGGRGWIESALPEITVVTGVITTHQVPECGLAVSYVGSVGLAYDRGVIRNERGVYPNC